VDRICEYGNLKTYFIMSATKRLLLRDRFTQNSHHQRIVNACVQKFREARRTQLSNLRHIDPHLLPSIASNLLTEVSQSDGLQDIQAAGKDDGIDDTSMSENGSNHGALHRSESHEYLVFYILEALEAEMAELEEDEHQAFITEAYESNCYNEDTDISIEYDCDEELICPFCRIRPMILNPSTEIARCGCTSYDLPYTSFGDVSDFKRVLASVFDR
jgi:hypothetical protein